MKFDYKGFHRSSYWRTWSRYWVVTDPTSAVRWYLELDLSPVNGFGRSHDPDYFTSLWAETAGGRVRFHLTSPRNGDVFTDALPEDALKVISANLPADVLAALLAFDPVAHARADVNWHKARRLNDVLPAGRLAHLPESFTL